MLPPRCPQGRVRRGRPSRAGACGCAGHTASTGADMGRGRQSRQGAATPRDRSRNQNVRTPAVLHGWRYLGDHESMHPDQVALRAGSHVAGARSATPSRRWDADWAWFW